MKNTHHHRDHTTTHRTPCIHLSNSHCTVFTKACVPTQHQCEPLARCNQTHLAELWLCHGRRWRRCSRRCWSRSCWSLSFVQLVAAAAANICWTQSLCVHAHGMSHSWQKLHSSAYCCFATPSMSTPAMSTPATWCRDVHSHDFSAPIKHIFLTLSLYLVQWLLANTHDHKFITGL